MTVLIVGGTGRIGQSAVQNLNDKKIRTKVLSRSEEKINSLPGETNGVLGDLEKPDSLPDAFSGIKKLLLITANGETETERGINAVSAAKSANIDKIVFISVKLSEEAMKVPHYASKVPIEKAIKDSGINYTILRPDFFYQNDILLEKPITLAGLYTMPIGNIGQNRIDTRDVADAAVRSIIEDGFNGKDIPLYGPKSWTADEIAETYSNKLDREVRYAGDDLEAWAESSKAFMPPWLISALKAGFAKMQAMGSVATEEQIEISKNTVGHQLRTFEDFVTEVTKNWKK
jgi:uncharacterized protein YbjT (DUF2867 family)